MHLSASALRRRTLSTVLITSVLLLGACNSGQSGRGPNFLGTFPMGARVQATPLVYTVVNAEWKPALTDGGAVPKHRFLVVRVSTTNSGGETVAMPPFQLESSDGKTTYQEVTEGMSDFPGWLGMLRMVEPAQTQEGYVVFDAPVAAYKLLMYDGNEVDKEKYAIVDIPVSLE